MISVSYANGASFIAVAYACPLCAPDLDIVLPIAFEYLEPTYNNLQLQLML